MKDWIQRFEAAVNGGPVPEDIIGAGKASARKALGHYRFQHEAKMKEAVEETFPALLTHLRDSWEEVWKKFWQENPVSPRSLDWFPEIFLRHFLTTDSPRWQKELARFEHVMDVHPWNHLNLLPREGLVPTEDSRIVLGNHEIVSFRAPVTKLYDGEAVEEFEEEESVVIWQKDGGVYYRALTDWELRVFRKLSVSVEDALTEAPEDPEAVGEFFQWLGSSCLIQELKRV